MNVKLNKLLTVLNTSGLQQKDTPLYEVVSQLISTLRDLENDVLAISGGSGSSVINYVTNQVSPLGGSNELNQNEFPTLIGNPNSNTVINNYYNNQISPIGITSDDEDNGFPTLLGNVNGNVSVVFPTPFVIGDLFYADSTGTIARLADVAVGSVLVSGGVGVAPSWSNSPTVTTLTASSSLIVPSGGKIYVDGGGDTYVFESATNTFNVIAGGINSFFVGTTYAAILSGNLFYIDGGSDTYIYESAPNTFLFITEAVTALQLTRISLSTTNIIPFVNNIYNIGAVGSVFANIYATNFIGNLSGSTSTLNPGRTINTVLFDGSTNIVVTAAAGTLTGTTLNATVITSSLTSVGVLNSGSITSGFGSIDIGSDTITSGLINGQTISSSANFTGTITIAGVTTISGGIITSTGATPILFKPNNVTRMSIGTDGDPVSILVSLVVSNDITTSATKRLYLDGGSNTYIYESSADVISFVSGGVGVITFSSTLITTALPIDCLNSIRMNGTLFYLDAGGDTYIYESSANVVSIKAGGTTTIQSTSSLVSVLSSNFAVDAAKKIYMNGSTANSYIFESSSAGDIYIVGRGTTVAVFQNSAANIIGVWNASTGVAANVNIASGGELRFSTSLKKHKTNLRPIDVEDAKKVIKSLGYYKFNSTLKGDNPDLDILGCVADEADEFDNLNKVKSDLAQYDDKGNLSSFDYRGLSIYLAAIVSDLLKQQEIVQ